VCFVRKSEQKEKNFFWFLKIFETLNSFFFNRFVPSFFVAQKHNHIIINIIFLRIEHTKK
tara:strand:+ start:3622 stop:3801 length:180 start_codon:yes stop_codon:yes gene_type:complete